ncbi:hypothetical protein ACFL29_01190 [Patescibacteria group bacterium]
MGNPGAISRIEEIEMNSNKAREQAAEQLMNFENHFAGQLEAFFNEWGEETLLESSPEDKPELIQARKTIKRTWKYIKEFALQHQLDVNDVASNYFQRM